MSALAYRAARIQCSGCQDPDCDCAERIEAQHEAFVERETDRIESSPGQLADLFSWQEIDNKMHRIGEAVKLAIERDDLPACDILREVFRPAIIAEVERRWKGRKV